jgi:hypothetical protein
MAPETLLYFVVGEGLCLIGTFKSLKAIFRMARAKVVWGEILEFKRMPEELQKTGEDAELPDYFIEVKYKWEGVSHTTNSVIKKEIHYEKGGKIKVYLPNGETESAVVDYNIKVSHYVMLITCLSVGLFIAWQCLLHTPVDMSIHF